MKKMTYVLLMTLILSVPSRVFADEPLIGEVKIFAGNFAPRGWAFCHGQLLSISQYTTLFSLLGTTYGGDGRTTFALPDLRARVAIGAGQYRQQANSRLGERRNNRMVNAESEQRGSVTIPTLGLNYIIAMDGIYPSRS